MTIETTTNRAAITGNGIATDIAFPYPVHNPSTDLVVIETVIATGVQITRAITTYWTWTGTADASGHYPDGGTVVAVTAPASTVTWTVYRDPPATQELDLVENDGAPAEAQEAQFDYLTMLIQRIKEVSARTLRQPDGDTANIDALPAKVARASMFLAFDSDGDPIAAAGTSANLGPVSAFIDTFLPSVDAAAARAILGITVTSNKDDEFLVTGSSDTTKKLAFEVDTKVPTASTVTVTAPAISGSMALLPTFDTYTGTANLAAGVGLAWLTGVTFTLTLPLVAANAGRQVTLRHQGVSLTQVYTIKGNGAENIIAPDGTANTFLLYTNGEEITLLCDGTSWHVLHHRAETDWKDEGPMTITGVTANPTKPTTPDYDHVFWRRSGKQATVKWLLQISSAAGSAAGTGAYLFALPTGIAIDTASVTAVATGWATATMSEGMKAAVFGTGKAAVDSANLDIVTPFAFSASTLQWALSTSGNPIGSAAYALTNAELGYYLEARFTAANWRV